MPSDYLNVSHLSLTYHSKDGETQALSDVTFSVDKNEFVAIVGPSGSGKTTVLSILAGLLKPSSGEVTLEGKPLSECSEQISLMPQRDQLFEWRTIRQNVLLGPEIKHRLNADTRHFADELLEKYGLKDFASRHPSELSGGMRQRAALIRTLVTSPKVLLLDEPFSALDFQTRLKVCDDVHSIIKSEQKTALLVTHDISEAISLADKVILLSKRPATVKDVLNIVFENDLTPLKRRDCAEFPYYFKRLWQGLEDSHDKGT